MITERIFPTKMNPIVFIKSACNWCILFNYTSMTRKLSFCSSNWAAVVKTNYVWEFRIVLISYENQRAVNLLHTSLLANWHQLLKLKCKSEDTAPPDSSRPQWVSVHLSSARCGDKQFQKEWSVSTRDRGQKLHCTKLSSAEVFLELWLGTIS